MRSEPGLYNERIVQRAPYAVIEVRCCHDDLVRQEIRCRIDLAEVQVIPFVSSYANQKDARIVCGLDRVRERKRCFLGDKAGIQQCSPACVDDRSPRSNRIEQRTRGVGYGRAELARVRAVAPVEAYRQYL